MESCGEKEGGFPQTFKIYVDAILKIYRHIQGKTVCIAICSKINKNHINVDLANQLMLSESYIMEDNKFFFLIKDMRLRTYNYMLIITRS